MIEVSDYQIFLNHISSLKETSKDTSGPIDIYMCNDVRNVIDFDGVKTEYTNNLGLSEEVASSFDALAFDPYNLRFIEFKNGGMKNEKKGIKNKIRDSLLIFCDITKKDISYIRANMDFILVYNGEKNPIPNQIIRELQPELSERDQIGDYFTRKARKHFIRFDLDRFQSLYFKTVYTVTPDQFSKMLAGN